MARKSFSVTTRRATSSRPTTFGTITATRMPTMITTIMISMSVKPLLRWRRPVVATFSSLLALLPRGAVGRSNRSTGQTTSWFMFSIGTRIASTMVSTKPAMNSSINGCKS